MESTSSIRMHLPEHTLSRHPNLAARESRAQPDFAALVDRDGGAAVLESLPANDGTGTSGFRPSVMFQLPPASIGGDGFMDSVPAGEVGPDGEPIDIAERYSGPLPAEMPESEFVPPPKDAIPPSPDGIPQDAPTIEGIQSEPPETIQVDTIVEVPSPGASGPDMLAVPSEFVAHAIQIDLDALLDPIKTT